MIPGTCGLITNDGAASGQMRQVAQWVLPAIRTSLPAYPSSAALRGNVHRRSIAVRYLTIRPAPAALQVGVLRASRLARMACGRIKPRSASLKHQWSKVLAADRQWSLTSLGGVQQGAEPSMGSALQGPVSRGRGRAIARRSAPAAPVPRPRPA